MFYSFPGSKALARVDSAAKRTCPWCHPTPSHEGCWMMHSACQPAGTNFLTFFASSFFFLLLFWQASSHFGFTITEGAMDREDGDGVEAVILFIYSPSSLTSIYELREITFHFLLIPSSLIWIGGRREGDGTAECAAFIRRSHLPPAKDCCFGFGLFLSFTCAYSHNLGTLDWGFFFFSFDSCERSHTKSPVDIP